jgi:hypothetical protein
MEQSYSILESRVEMLHALVLHSRIYLPKIDLLILLSPTPESNMIQSCSVLFLFCNQTKNPQPNATLVSARLQVLHALAYAPSCMHWLLPSLHRYLNGGVAVITVCCCRG